MISWTASKVESANYCGMRYYLTYLEKEKSLWIPAYAKGSLLHNMVEHFWTKLGTEEQVAKESSGKKYSNSEEFAKYCQGLWMRTLIGSKFSENPIQWEFDEQGYVIHAQLKEICLPLFPLLISEGPPLLSEKRFKFKILGREFSGRLDDVRLKDGKVIIRDYKSGYPKIGEMRTKNDTQLTLYNIAVCSLCASDDELAEKLGVLQKRGRFMGKPDYINPDFVTEYFMIEAPYQNMKKNLSLPVTLPSIRTNEHFLELMKRIDSIERMVNEGEIVAERGKKCDYCDVKYACDKRLKQIGAGHLEDRMGQGLLSYAIPLFARDEEQKGLFGQKTFRFPKQ